MFFDRRLSDRDMCDPPTRPRPRSLLFGGRYSAEANAARAERWRTLAVLQTRGVETAGWKAQASAATDAASAASDAACDAREARETELGTHEANATRSSQVVVSTATPELESEEKTWAKRVPWSRVNVVHRDTDTNVADEGVDLLSSATDDDEDDKRFFDATGDPVPSRSPFAVCSRRAKDGSHSSIASSLAFEAERESSVRRENRSGLGVGEATCLASPRDLRARFDGADDDAPRGSAPEENELTEESGEDPSRATVLGSAKTPREARAFLEAVEAVEREDESRRREAERFIAATRGVDRREANAAALTALRRSLELNSPPAPPRVRTRVPGRSKKPKSSASAAKSRATNENENASARATTRRRDEKTSWEPEKTWPPLPAAEPDETAVAEEEAEAAKAEGGVARPGDEATPNGEAAADRASASSSSSVWAAIVAADSDKTKTTEVFELVADTRNDKAASPIGRAEAETLSKEVFEETAPAVFAADAREGAKSPLLEDDDAEATRRRCEAAVAALEDAVRLALDARAAAAACAPNAAAEMDKKMADAAQALLSDRTRETNGLSDFSPSARFFSFDAEECFAPTWPCVFVSGGTEKEHVPRVCRWRSAHGSSFALGCASLPGADPAGDSIDSESRLERLMERAVERCLAKFGDGIVRAVRASSQASSP